METSPRCSTPILHLNSVRIDIESQKHEAIEQQPAALTRSTATQWSHRNELAMSSHRHRNVSAKLLLDTAFPYHARRDLVETDSPTSEAVAQRQQTDPARLIQRSCLFEAARRQLSLRRLSSTATNTDSRIQGDAKPTLKHTRI